MVGIAEYEKYKEKMTRDFYSVQFQVRMSEKLYEKILKDAEEQDRPRSYIVRKILENFYRKRDEEK